MRPPSPAPWLRAGVFSALSVGLGVLGHRWSGGAGPGWPWVALCLLAVAVAARAGVERERSLLAVMGGTLSVQVVTHVVFALTSAASGAGWSVTTLVLCQHAGAVSAVGTVGTGHPGPVPLHLVGQPTVPALSWLHLLVAAAPMVGAHLVAALVLAGWLRQGEALAWRLADAPRGLLCLLALVTTAMPPTHAGRRGPRGTRTASALAVLADIVTVSAPRRGPPARCAA